MPRKRVEEPQVIRSFSDEVAQRFPKRGDERGLTLTHKKGTLPAGCLARYTASREGESWRVDAFMGRTQPDGPLVLVRVTIDPGDFIGGVTPELVKRIRLRDLREAVIARAKYELSFQQLRDELGWPLAPREVRKRLRAVVEADKEAPVQRGRPALPDEFLRGVAEEYLELQAAGYGQARGKGILTEFAKRRNRERETVRDWIRKARDRGYLTRGEPGRAGAEPGPRLLDVPEPETTHL